MNFLLLTVACHTKKVSSLFEEKVIETLNSFYCNTMVLIPKQEQITVLAIIKLLTSLSYVKRLVRILSGTDHQMWRCSIIFAETYGFAGLQYKAGTILL